MPTLQFRLVKLEQCTELRSANPVLKSAVWQFDALVNQCIEMREWIAGNCTPSQAETFNVWANSGAPTSEMGAVFELIGLPDYLGADYVWMSQRFSEYSESLQLAAAERWREIGCESLRD